MRRVASRQRLVSWDAFDATADDDSSSSDEYETCYEEGNLSRHSSFVSIVDLASASSTSFDTLLSVEVECDLPVASIGRKRDRPSKTAEASAIRRALSSSSLARPVEAPVVVPAYNYEIMNTSTQPLDTYALHELMGDVQLHIVSFLSASDARSVSSTCHYFRHLLLSDEARHLWKEWYRRQWPILSKLRDGDMTFRDDLSVPTAAAGIPENDGRDDAANLSVLLGLASKTNPSKIDGSHFLPRTLNPRLHRWRRPTLTERRIEFRKFSQNNLDVVQFTGAVGSGDRCIRSDEALARPAFMKSVRIWSFKSLPPAVAPPIGEEENYRNTFSKSSLLDFLCRGARAVVSNHAMWRPFVAPYMSLDSAGQQQVHLTPRLVSYFEVSILERDESQEPPQQQADMASPTGTRMDGRAVVPVTDCVAIGVSSGIFHLHSKMPGWDSMSYGYHGDDGGIFHASGDMVRRFGPSYGAGDTVGCGVDYVCGGIFFTLNGNFLGYGWTDVDPEYLQHNLYPTVGVDTNCPIACNFGDRPFAFDLAPFIERHTEVVECCLSPLMANKKTDYETKSEPSSPQHRRPKLHRCPTSF